MAFPIDPWAPWRREFSVWLKLLVQIEPLDPNRQWRSRVQEVFPSLCLTTQHFIRSKHKGHGIFISGAKGLIAQSFHSCFEQPNLIAVKDAFESWVETIRGTNGLHRFETSLQVKTTFFDLFHKYVGWICIDLCKGLFTILTEYSGQGRLRSNIWAVKNSSQPYTNKGHIHAKYCMARKCLVYWGGFRERIALPCSSNRSRVANKNHPLIHERLLPNHVTFHWLDINGIVIGQRTKTFPVLSD